MKIKTLTLGDLVNFTLKLLFDFGNPMDLLTFI